MKHPVRVLERLTRVSLLGVRFWDSLTESPVSAGLEVVAYPKVRPTRRVRATVNHAGVFVFHGLSGLQDVENGAAEEGHSTSPPQGREFVVEVMDKEDRFLPFWFAAPLPVHGLFTWPAESVASSPPTSPLAPVPAVPLYSSPVRAIPAGMAVLRATLYDPAFAAPAAWAMLEVHQGDRWVRGVADGEGRVAVIFPYPEPTPAIGSPPEEWRLTRQRWTLPLRARYGPSSPPQAASALLDLRATLAPRNATLWIDTMRTQPFTQADLQFGQELVLRSRRTTPAGPDPRSALWITSD